VASVPLEWHRMVDSSRMKRRKGMDWTLSAFALLFIASSAGCNPVGRYDLVIRNAKIWTGDASNPSAQVLAIGGVKFLFVGQEKDFQLRPIDTGINTVIIDARGARIIPGLIDSHLHLISGGLQMARIQLRDVPNREAFIAAIGAWAKKTPTGRWITGGRWSTESWPDAAQPTKEWIDPVTPDHPVLLSRMDGHGALANSVALKLAGIDAKGPPDPGGGVIDRDPKTHEPTGMLRDAAIELVAGHQSEPSDGELDTALVAAMKEANRHGITCVHTMSPWRDVAVLDRARRKKTLTLRARVYVMEEDWRPFISKADAHGGDDSVGIRGFKQFADGSLGSRTAFMAAPFADNPPEKRDWRGLLREVMQGPEQFNRFCDAAFSAGYAPATHAIGDQANHVVVDTYERMIANARRSGTSEGTSHATFSEGAATSGAAFASGRTGGSGIPRPRVEHAQHLLPADIRRFATLGVIASMQPYHKADDGRYAEKAIGAERCKTSYAFRSLLDAGAHVAFGSDWPVVTLNPFLGIQAAVTGRTPDGKVFVPEQNITVEEALRCYTTGAAYAAGDEMVLGQIKIGRPADLVLLDQDILTSAPENLGNLRAVQTFVGGKEVWKNPLLKTPPK